MTAMLNATCAIFAKTEHPIKSKTVNIGAELGTTNVFVTVFVEKVFVSLANLSVIIQSKL